MRVKDVGHAPEEHVPEQLCPLCDDPFFDGDEIVVWQAGSDRVLEFVHERCWRLEV